MAQAKIVVFLAAKDSQVTPVLRPDLLKYLSYLPGDTGSGQEPYSFAMQATEHCTNASTCAVITIDEEFPLMHSPGQTCLGVIETLAVAEGDYSEINPVETKLLFYSGARSGLADLVIKDEKCYDGITGGAGGFTIAAMNITHRYEILQDPHLHFAHGGRADFRGRHGRLYSFFSAPGLAVNLKTENATFPLDRKLDGSPPLIVHGSFVTEAHVVARVGGDKRKLANFSFWASRLGENNWAWDVVTGSCGGHKFKLGKGGRKACEEAVASVAMAHATFTIGDVSVVVKGSPTHAIAGPSHRLDVGFTLHGDYAARSLPHGIFGQSFSSSKSRNGKLDIYPEEGEFTTEAMAEVRSPASRLSSAPAPPLASHPPSRHQGAIDGDAALYEVPGPYETDFIFSRFNAAPAPKPEPALVAEIGRTASASSVESAK